MINNKNILLLILSGLLSAYSFAQESITIQDAEEIRFKSENLIKRELKDLLNNLSNSSIELKETQEVILNSYSGERNRIFLSAKVLVEDDINPSFHSSNNTRDVEVDKYLKDFDLLYKKSDGPSVIINVVKVSNVKRSNSLYVKVYFSSFFRNPNTTSDTAYTLNNRMAEISIQKENGKWSPFISRIGFYTAADTLNDFSNDLVLMQVKNAGSGSVAQDSNSVARRQILFENELKETERKRLIEEDQAQTQTFNDLISQGDKALGTNDFTKALDYYKQAKEARPYDPLPPGKINNANKARERATITADQLFQQFIGQASLQEKKREYEQAIISYNKAIAQKPDESAKYDVYIRDLTAKFRDLAELEEKYKAGLYKEAIKQYDGLIKKNKTISDYFLGRGKCYDKTGDVKNALKDYSQAYQLDGNNLDAIQQRADLYKRTNNPYKALTDYKTYLTISNENSRVYEQMAELRLLINANNLDDAIKDLSDGLLVDPKALDLYLKRGQLLARKNDYKRADSDFTSVVQLDSNNALGFYLRGKCELALKHIDNAAFDFESARRNGLEAADKQDIELLGAAYFQRAADNSLANGKDSALILTNMAIAIDPYNGAYRYGQGEYLFAQNKYPEAIASYTEAIRLKPNYADAYYHRAVAYEQEGGYKPALDDFKAALAITPQLIPAQKGLGDASLALQDYAGAANAYENCLQTINATKANSDRGLLPEVFNGAGKSYLGLNNTEKAISAFKNALKRNGSYADAYYNMGFAYFESNQMADAITNISKAVSLDNKHAVWYYYQGKSLMAKGQYANAAAAFGNCVPLDTLNQLSDVLYLKGYCNAGAQNYAGAIGDYLKFESEPPRVEIKTLYQDIGKAYLNLGKYDSAFNWYNKDLAKDSTNGVTLYGMATSLALKGKIDEALPWFEKSFQTRMVPYNDIKKDRLIGNIRDDKRFKSLLKKYY